MPPSIVTPTKRGQPTVEVGLAVVSTVEIAPSATSSVLAKRKWDDSAGLFG